MNRKTITLLLAICLCLPVANAFGDGHEGGGDHPPMLVIMPPPDTEKPEGVEMTGDPEQDWIRMAMASSTWLSCVHGSIQVPAPAVLEWASMTAPACQVWASTRA